MLFLGFFAAIPGFGENFQIKGFELLCFGLGNGLINGGEMNHFTPCFVNTVPAIKIPKIDIRGKNLPAFSFDIFFNFMLDGFNQPGNFDLRDESF